MNPIYELQQILRQAKTANDDTVFMKKTELVAIIDALLTADMKQFITNEVNPMCEEDNPFWKEMEERIANDCCPMCNDDEPTMNDNGVSIVGNCDKCDARWSAIHRIELLEVKRDGD